MNELKIKGYSDDIISVYLNGKGFEEFGAYEIEDCNIVCSDGSCFSVSYDGIWRFTPVTLGSAEYSKHEATDEDTDYSDIKWVALTKSDGFTRIKTQDAVTA
jgi:hypothetical protein